MQTVSDKKRIPLWDRLMNWIYGTVAVLLCVLAIFVVGKDGREGLGLFGGDPRMRQALSNPGTWLMFVGFVLVAVIFQLLTRRAKKQRVSYDETALREDLSSVNISDMARELWNPINGIADQLAVMMGTDENEEIGVHVHELVTANEEISTVVNELVDFAMIASRKMKIADRPYQTKDLLGRLYEQMREPYEQKGLAWVVRCDPHIPVMLVGDAAHIYQVILVILMNALKYTESGSVTLSVGMETLFAGDVGFVISIRDTGRGMSAETMANLFNSYQTAANAKEAGFEGTGLGMAIVKRLLELMKGSVSVQSEAGEGTEFVLRIPQRVYDVAEIGEPDFLKNDAKENKKKT